MRQEDIKRAFDQMSFSDDRKDEVFRRITERGQEKSRNFFVLKKAAAAILFLAVIGAAAVGADDATGGGISRAIGNLFGWNTSIKEVTEQAEKDIFLSMIYAPDVICLDEERLIFATDRGLIICGRKDGTVQTIDLQQTDCIYWETSAGEIHTHALYEEGDLWLFNEKNGERFGKFYRYALGGTDFAAEESEDDELWTYVHEKWLTERVRYVDTFDTFEEIGLGETHIHPNDQGIYSKSSYRYQKEDGKIFLAYLTVPTDEYGNPVEKKFILNIFDVEAGLTTAEEVKLSMGETKDSVQAEKAEEGLPDFVYTGEDEAVEAIWGYMKEIADQWYDVSEEKTCIPAFMIYGQSEKDNSLYVFGDFWVYVYYRNGNTLECNAGGAFPARFELKKNQEGGYDVAEVLQGEDGSGYERSIREFTEGFEGMYEMYFKDWESPENIREKTRTDYIRMYEEENHLGIRYYKDYGWDPVSIRE